MPQDFYQKTTDAFFAEWLRVIRYYGSRIDTQNPEMLYQAQ